MQPGTYTARAISADLMESKEKRTPGVTIVFQLEEGGETISANLWLSEKALARTVESLRACGWQGDDLSELSTVGTKACSLVIEDEEYNGNYYPRVKWVNKLGGGTGGAEPMDDKGKKAFAARMRGAVIAASGGKASTPPARGAGGAPQRQAPVSQQRAEERRPPPGYQPEPPDFGPGPDEDIPF